MTELMPAVFVGHGSPMNALERNGYTDAWRALGAAVPRPRAIVVVSAHWYINATAVTAMARPRMIHDFYGFPARAVRLRLPRAPGRPRWRTKSSRSSPRSGSASTTTAGASTTARGRCSPTSFPDADVPVVQLSINADEPLEYHLDLGRRLAPLRERGRALIVGSGNVVHNLATSTGASRSDPASTGPSASTRGRGGPDRFAGIDRAPPVAPRLPASPCRRRTTSCRSCTSPAWRRPPASRCATLTEGYVYGSLSMTSFSLGFDGPLSSWGDPGEPASLGSAPPEDTNL